MTVNYDLGNYHISVLLILKGSLIPRGLFMAMFPAILAFVIRYTLNETDFDTEWLTELRDSNVWPAMNGVLSLVLAFRTSQALDRFWEGSTVLHQMRAEWLDGCSALIAFSSGQMAKRPDEVWKFWHTLTRLGSLLHAFALYEVKEHSNEHFEVIDIEGLDDESLEFLKGCAHINCPRVEIVLHWIQQLIGVHIRNGIIDIPPPIVSRVFQELSSGMVHLHNAKKITDTPFPFPYAQFITFALVVHSILTPFIVAAAVLNPYLAAGLTMSICFAFWCINMIAGELENPFGDDVNDLALNDLQEGMNSSLVMLLDTRVHRVPSITSRAVMDPAQLKLGDGLKSSRTDTIENFQKSAIRASMRITYEALSTDDANRPFSLSSVPSLPSSRGEGAAQVPPSPIEGQVAASVDDSGGEAADDLETTLERIAVPPDSLDPQPSLDLWGAHAESCMTQSSYDLDHSEAGLSSRWVGDENSDKAAHAPDAATLHANPRGVEGRALAQSSLPSQSAAHPFISDSRRPQYL